MTLAQLNEHLDAVQQLARTEETLKNLWDAAVPGAQKLTGMPHASGVRDKVADLLVVIAYAALVAGMIYAGMKGVF